jgi:hypothetical protein
LARFEGTLFLIQHGEDGFYYDGGRECVSMDDTCESRLHLSHQL